MGAYKMRQGVSINLGLAMNKPKVKSPPKFKHIEEAVAQSVSWLTAVVHAITQPFVKMVQNYRGRGNR